MKKKILLLSAAVIALAAVCVIGYTLAYFTAETDEVTNTFTVGNISLLLREPTWDGYTFEDDDFDVDGSYTPPTGKYSDYNEDYPNKPVVLGIEEAAPLMPGDVIYKDPTVKNTGDNDFYVRLLVTVSHYDSFNAIGGYDISKMIKTSSDWEIYPAGTFTVDDDDTTAIDESTITYEYRYTGNGGILKSIKTADAEEDTITAPLFTEVIIPDALDDELESIGQFTISIKAQAIQADNFAGSEAAFDALDQKYPVEP